LAEELDVLDATGLAVDLDVGFEVGLALGLALGLEERFVEDRRGLFGIFFFTTVFSSAMTWRFMLISCAGLSLLYEYK